MAFLNWDHLVYAWIESSQAFKTKDVVWGLTEKPLQLLMQIIDRPNHRLDPDIVSRSHGPIGRQTLHLLNTVLYGFSGHIATHFAGSEASRLNQYSALWSAVEHRISNILSQEDMPEDVIMSVQEIFAALLAFKRHNRLLQRWSPERLLSKEILAGWTAISSSLDAAAALAETEWSKCVKPEEIPSFSQEWILEHTQQCLHMLSRCINANLRLQHSQETGDPVLPPCPVSGFF